VKVGLVTPYDLSVEGGVNRHVQSLARELSRLGHECLILGPASGEVPAGCHGVRGVVPVPANGSVARIGLLASARASSELLSRHRVDLVHVHEPLVPGPGRHALAWARRLGRPVVATFHANADRELPLQTLLRRLVGRGVGRLDYGIAVSRQAKRFSRAVWRGRTAVVPNGVDLSRFTERVEQLPEVRHPHRTLQVLFVGRFGEPRKGFEVLLDAARRLRRAGRPAEVTVVGSGPEARYRARAARLGVRFAGRLADEPLAAAYREADVFCAPSLGGESFGMVLVEAMAAGCPVVASDIPGYAEAARGAAVLVPRKDGAALAEALWQVGTDAALRERLVARGRVRAQTLCWTRVAAHVDRIYAFASGARAAGRRRPRGRRP
jgi:phosphatidylinositol alpha-mannosyltransferase